MKRLLLAIIVLSSITAQAQKKDTTVIINRIYVNNPKPAPEPTVNVPYKELKDQWIWMYETIEAQQAVANDTYTNHMIQSFEKNLNDTRFAVGLVFIILGVVAVIGLIYGVITGSKSGNYNCCNNGCSCNYKPTSNPIINHFHVSGGAGGLVDMSSKGSGNYSNAESNDHHVYPTKIVIAKPVVDKPEEVKPERGFSE